MRQIIRFLKVLERTMLKPKLNLSQKLWKVLGGSPVIGESLNNKDSLLVYVLRFFRILEDRCGKGERLGYERTRFEVRVPPWVAIFVRFKRYTLNNRSKIF